MIRIPFFIKLRIILSKMYPSVILTGIAFYFFTQYVSKKDWYATYMLNDSSPIAQGIVLDKWEENYSENDNGEEFYTYGYSYKFTAPSGEEFFWTSFSSYNKYKKGDTIPVRYNKDYPKVNKAVGMRNEADDPENRLIWPLIFMTGAIAISAYRGDYKVLLVAYKGKFALAQPGTLHKIEYEDENGKRESSQYDLLFTFHTQEGEETRTYIRTSNPFPIKDEEEELIIYFTYNPKIIVAVDSFPKSARKFLYKEYERISGKKLRRKVI